MAKTDDPVALNQWYAIETSTEVGPRPRVTRLLGQEITLWRHPDGTPEVRERAADGTLGQPLPVRERYGCLWTTLGAPTGDIFAIAEAEEPNRRFVLCGWVTMRASAPRIVENFLDMAHFPYVHTDILGAEPDTDVPDYATEIRAEGEELWATGCTFFQSRIANTESGGDFAQLTYRVPAPFMVMLYRVCPSQPSRLDAIALFIQPMEEDLCRAQPVMYLVDESSPHTDLVRFEDTIFLQDRIIVENQRPLLIPLEAGEIPVRADRSSVAYRRWLKAKGLRFATAEGARAPSSPLSMPSGAVSA